MMATNSVAWRALILTALVFSANFSVWTIYASIGMNLMAELQLSAFYLGLLLAAPIFSGALLRLLLGLLLPVVMARGCSAKLIVCVLMMLLLPGLALLPQAVSYGDYVLFGFWLGLGGASLVACIAYLTPWFNFRQQGFALGILGAGSIGAAVSLFFFPFLIKHWGWHLAAPIYALGLGAMLIFFAWLAPAIKKVNAAQVTKKNSVPDLYSQLQVLLQALQEPRLWRLSLYYYFVFGSFIALILWLPNYYVQAYEQPSVMAIAYTLIFVVASSMAQALGGWLADQYAGRAINWGVFWVCLGCLFFLSYPPTTMIIHGLEKDVELRIHMPIGLFAGLTFVLAVALGVGRASVFKLIQLHYPRNNVEISGLVAFVGALGGASLPIVFGVAQDLMGVSTACFMVLYGVLAICMMALYWAIQSEQYQELLARNRAHNFLQD